MGAPVLLLVAILALALYVPISRGRPRRLCNLQIDERVPFVPPFVIAYLALFLYVPLTIWFLYSTSYGPPLLIALATVGVLYAVIGPRISCGAPRADAKGPGALRALVRLVYRLDGAYNNAVCPSTHVYLALICGYYLASAFPTYALLVGALTALIAISTVFVKQHNVMDIGAGALFAFIAITFAGLLGPLVVYQTSTPAATQALFGGVSLMIDYATTEPDRECRLCGRANVS